MIRLSLNLAIRLQSCFNGSPPSPASSGLDVHGLQRALNQAFAVVGIEDIKARSERCNLGFNAQLAGAEAVKCSDP